MSSFLSKSSLKVSLDKIPQYSGFKGNWTYKIDKQFIDAVLKYDGVDSNGNPIISEVSKSVFKNNIVDKLRNNTLSVQWRSTFGIPYGRLYSGGWFENVSMGSIGSLPRSIKNSFFAREGWVDFDFKKCHPTLISELVRMSKINIDVSPLKKYIDNFDDIVEAFISHFSKDEKNNLDKGDIKGLFNLTIYGGSFDSWKEWVATDDPKKCYVGKPVKDVCPPQFYFEFKKCIDEFTARAIQDNYDLYEVVRSAKEDILIQRGYEGQRLKNKMDKSFISFYLQIFEKDCLYHAYQYFVKNGWIMKRQADLCYDGFTAKLMNGCPPLNEMIYAVNTHIIEQTGLVMTITDKKLECVIDELLNATLQEEGGVCDGDTYESAQNEFSNHPEYLKFKNAVAVNFALIEDICKYVYIKKIDGENKLTFYSENEIKTLWRHYHFQIKIRGMFGDKIETIYMSSVWFDDPTKIRYSSIQCFPPPLVCPAGVLNSWGGSMFDEYPFETADIKDDPDFVPDAVDFFVSHIRDVICDGDLKATEYILCYLAHAIKCPAVKPSVMIVIQGTEGCGKSSVAELLGRFFRKDMFLQTADPEKTVWSTFNGQMANAYIVDLEEVGKAQSGNAVEIIKNLITSKFIDINEKGIKKRTINSYHRFISPTNNIDPYKISENDRRMVFTRCSDMRKGDREYFEKWNSYFNFNMKGEYNNFNAMRSLYWTLKNTENVEEWDWTAIPDTKMRRELKEENRPFICRFLEALAMKNYHQHRFDVIGFTGNQLLDEYNEWCRSNGYNTDNNSGVLIKRLKREVKLPEGAYFTGKKTNMGVKQHFSIPLLIAHYRIGNIICDNGVFIEE